MCRLLAHRGPDDEGIFVKSNIGLGMRRLAVIDLEGGRQPQENEDHSIVLVFNGEIYNFLELREELIAKGHRFKTRSDTETIIHAYEEYGTQCLDRFKGMFAFALYDDRRKTLFLARDRLGIKPLYYLFDGRSFLFASELKSILAVWDGARQIDPQALDLFLTLEYIPSPLTLVKGIKKLPPGTFLLFREGRLEERSYWDIPLGDPIEDPRQAEEGLRALLDAAVRRRMVADVPLGVFLSGGVDSAAVVSRMAAHSSLPVNSFSIGFEESSYNELRYARRLAGYFHTNHRERILRPDAVRLIDRLMEYLDDPIGDFSIFPTYLVSQMAREEVTVVLSGDGGDELFGGYDTYLADRIDRLYRKIPRFLRDGLFNPIGSRLPPSASKKGPINRIKRFLEGSALPEELGHMRWMIFLDRETKRRLYGHDFSQNLAPDHAENELLRYFQRSPFPAGSLESQLYVDTKLYLPENILAKVDRMSMAASLEARVPLLDHELVEFAARIPGRFKIKGFRRKHVFKEALRGSLPPEILSRGKEGFSIPLKNWLRGELRPLLLDTLSPSKLEKEGYFHGPFVESLVREHLEGTQNHSHLLWCLVVFELWLERHFTRSFRELEQQPAGR